MNTWYQDSLRREVSELEIENEKLRSELSRLKIDTSVQAVQRFSVKNILWDMTIALVTAGSFSYFISLSH